jgi:branched-chain amino acid transport system permease protein
VVDLLILQSIILGIPQGALYGLMAFGISLIFRTVGVMNFSHGNAGMFSAFIALTVFLLTQNLLLAILCAVIFGILLGFLIEKFLMRPVKHLSHGGMLIITLGILMILEGLAQIIWGVNPFSFNELVSAPPLIFTLGEDGLLILPLNDLLITVISLGITILLAVFLKVTKVGIAIRARSQDEVGSKVVGINTNMIDGLVWGIGISLSALVGVLIAPKTTVTPTMMINMQLYGFTAGVLGGFTSLYGSILGGIILGILEKIVGIYISPDYQLTIILLIIILMLAFKPSGLFAKKFEGRV